MPDDKFVAKPDKEPSFIDLGEGPSPIKESPRKKWYPTVSINKSVKGLDRLGRTANVTMKVRVKSLRINGDEEPRFELELRSMKVK